MINNNAKAMYQNLMGKYLNFKKQYQLKIDTPNQVGIYIAISSSKRPVFLFDVPLNHVNLATSLHETAGYRIVSGKSYSEYMRIGIEAATEHSFEVFYVVVDDLINVASDEKDSFFLEIITRLLLWEDFFKNTATGVLDFTTQIGLFGELLFIEEELEKGYSSIIEDWKGPFHDVKDFVINKTAVEVKTSTITATNRIHISDENQLDDSGFSLLLLNVRLLVINQMDGRSLPELIDAIRALLETDLVQLNLFNEKLMHAGYREEFGYKYNTRFEQSDIYWFDVKDSEDVVFPRIIPSNLVSGVKFVKYEIELSTIMPFSVDWICMRTELETTNK